MVVLSAEMRRRRTQIQTQYAIDREHIEVRSLFLRREFDRSFKETPLQAEAFADPAPLTVQQIDFSLHYTARFSFLPRFSLFDIFRQLLPHFAIGHHPASPNAPRFKVQMGEFGGEHRLPDLGEARVNPATFACLLSH